MTRFGLLGLSISYSLSPRLHGMIFNELHIKDASYDLIDTAPEALPQYAAMLRTGEYGGFNVTTPYKQAALALADEATDAARRVGACNLLHLENGRVIADNTDVGGFMRLVQSSGVEVSGLACALLGTGGAARAAAVALDGLGARSVTLYSREPEGKAPLAGAAIKAYGDFMPSDLIVNCTPHGTDMGFTQPLLLGAEAALELGYDPRVTPFMRLCEALGIPCQNGLDMLVWQALLSQERFWGRELDKPTLERCILAQI